MRPPHPSWQWRERQDGQALVEFALAVPIFVLVMFGLLDVGKLVYTNSVLSQAAREGARLGATQAAWIGVTAESGCVDDEASISSGNPGTHVCPGDVTAFKTNVIDAVHRMTVGLGPIAAVHVSCNGGGADPAPVGAWTDMSGGNGCHDGSGSAISSEGDLVSVRVEYTYQPMTPIISSVLGSVALSGSATMVIN